MQRAYAEGGTRDALEEGAGELGRHGGVKAAQSLTGGISAAVPGLEKAAGALGSMAGKLAFRGTAAMATGAGVVLLVIVLALSGAMTAVTAALTGGDNLGLARPTKEQCDAMPEKWCEVVYDAQQATTSYDTVVPWTVIAGLASAQTDFGRTSPYDSTDRYPNRATPPYLAAHPGGLFVGDTQGPPGPLGSVAGMNANQMANAATIIATGKQLGVPEYGWVIALSTALQESTMTNLDHGDRDSLGLFQQRPSQGWGKPQELMTPTYAATKFYQALLKVPGWQSMAVTVAAQKVQRSGYPSAYAKHEPVARALVAKLAAAAAPVTDGAPATGTGTTAVGPGYFTAPVPGAVVSGFGPRIHPATHKPNKHTGLDIMRPCGSDIRAAADGTVVITSITDSWGLRTVIEHAPGLRTAYGHQTAFGVKVGQRVTKGQVIGKIGTTGWSTGCHLHWDVVVNSNYVDPAPYLGLPASGNPPIPAPAEVTGSGPGAGALPVAVTPVEPYVEKGGDGCQVAPPSTPIGGEDGQGAGPFLLTGSAAEGLGDKAQNPCDSAKTVALALAGAAGDVARTSDLNAKDPDPAKAARFWQQVVLRAGVMASTDPGAASCTVTEDASHPSSVDALIESIWGCELDKAPNLYLVSDATRTGSALSFQVFDRDTARSQLIAEAKTVAWNFSQWKTDGCDRGAALAGVFPLTQQVAAARGTADRCDVQGNIRAAARAVIAGETVPVAKRSAPAGRPYAPMVGGWASLPAALGTERAAFEMKGPFTPWQAGADCQNRMETFLTRAAVDGSPFVALAGGTVPQDRAPLAAAVAKAGGPPSGAVCANPSASDLAGSLAEMAMELASAEADRASGPGADATAESTGGATTPKAQGAPARVNARAMQGLGVWFASQAHAAVPANARFGPESVVDRLAVDQHPAAQGPSRAAAELPAAPWQTKATDWAIFYGGFVRDPSTFGKRVGSLLANSGQTAATAATWGTASQQAQIVINQAKKWLGTPYSWGGGSPSGPTRGFNQGANTVGFDCSSLVQNAYWAAGIKLPRTATPQSKFGTVVPSLAQAAPGDLLLFGKGGKFHHIGMYLGGGMMIHAPRTGDVVRIQKVYETPALIKHVVNDASGSTTG